MNCDQNRTLDRRSFLAGFAGFFGDRRLESLRHDSSQPPHSPSISASPSRQICDQVSNRSRRLMYDWMKSPLAHEYSLTSDWDDRWRTGGSVAEVIEEAHLSARHILHACHESLRRLQTDFIDLYQMHHVWRHAPWDEIWQAMDTLVRQGWRNKEKRHQQ